jgi:hypothetical protein
MASFVSPAIFISLVRYGQNIGLILGLGSEEELGVKLQSFAEGLSSFFNRVFTYIPYFPKLDVRIRFVVLSWLIPTVFDVLFIWFTGGSIANLLHVVTLLSCFAFFYEVSFCVFSRTAETATYVLIPLSIIGWAIAIAYAWYRQGQEHRKNSDSLNDSALISTLESFADELERGADADLSGLKRKLEKHLEAIGNCVPTPTVWNLGVLGAVLLGGLFIILYGAGLLGPKEQRPNLVVGLFIIIPTALLMLVAIWVGISIIIPSWQESFAARLVKLRRYCLKGLLLILDCLYIPICQAMIDTLFAKKWHCPAGTYLDWDRVSDTLFGQWYDVDVNCSACAMFANISAQCEVACRGNVTEWHNNISQQLVLGPDIMGMAGPLIVYAILIVVIGQPIWWALLIAKNKELAWVVPAYGPSIAEKWTWLSGKLSSPGVVIFYEFTHTAPFWGFFLPVSKLVCVVLVQVIQFTTKAVSWLLMILYAAIVALYVYIMPYRFQFNNIFDIVCGISNTILTIFAIANFHGAVIPSMVQMPLTVIVICVPIVAVLYGFFRDKGNKTDEPGQSPEMTLCDIGGENEKWGEMRDSSWLVSIWKAEEMLKKTSPNSDLTRSLLMTGEDSTRRPEVRITQEVMTEILQLGDKIDGVCDAYSTAHVTTMIKIVSVISSGCAGWLFGGVAGRRLAVTDLDC